MQADTTRTTTNTDTEDEKKDQPGRFVDALARLAGKEDRVTPAKVDRAALAALRRGLGRSIAQAPVELLRYVVPWLPTRPHPYPQEDDTYVLIASLFGLHPRHEPTTTEPFRPRDLGTALRVLAAATNPQSTERRFMALLNADRDDLGTHLRHVVALLKGEDIPLDYADLLRDVLRWDHPRRVVQQRWARSYWAPERPDQTASPPPPPTAPAAAPAST